MKIQNKKVEYEVDELNNKVSAVVKLFDGREIKLESEGLLTDNLQYFEREILNRLLELYAV